MIRRVPRPPSQRSPARGSVPGLLRTAALACLLIVPAAARAQSITIDSFATGQATQTLTFPPAGSTTSASVSGAGILGGERDVEVNLAGGVTAGNGISAGVAGGLFSHSQDATITGTSQLVWDGADGAAAVNPTGLGGIDLTAAGVQDAFLLNVVSSDLTFTLTIEVWSDAGNASSMTLKVPGPIVSPTGIYIPYSLLTTALGTGADFTHVGAVAFTLGSTTSSPHLVLGPLQTAATLTSTKTVALDNDVNGDGQANPGDTLLYTVVITHHDSGLVTEIHGHAPALGVTFASGTPAYTTLVNGSVTSDQGSVTLGNNTGDTSVAVAVPILANNNTVTLQFAVTVNDPLPPGVTQVVCQGTVSSNTLTNALTDDPSLPGMSDPTVFPVFPLPVAVPTLDEWGLLALTSLLAALGLTRLRRRRIGTEPLPSLDARRRL
ncbi:MAG TPA: IPTL-CTERM sorting domain-containing protein [Thermoanaerobaculia bacterium]|nr:IPTL-CTERM sorting domain-containing protein [Thermoanaerobaculia bacterium]